MGGMMESVMSVDQSDEFAKSFSRKELFPIRAICASYAAFLLSSLRASIGILLYFNLIKTRKNAYWTLFRKM